MMIRETTRVSRKTRGRVLVRQMNDGIVVVAVGGIDANVLSHLRRELAKTFGQPSRVGKALPIPLKALDPSRAQYSAGAILEELHPEEAERMLAVVDLDMFVPGLNFVFGLADLPGRRAVIGLPRLRERFYGGHDDEELFLARVAKEAVHELGHTFGLQHCANRHCVMAFSNSLEDTDRKEQTFCSACGMQVSRFRRPHSATR
jgi:archaemetzincin